MVVVAKMGILERGGKVRTPEGIYEVRPGREGWYVVGGPKAEGPGQVRYDDARELLEIHRPGVDIPIEFRAELEHTTFELKGHSYEVGTMDFGEILIKEGTRPVVRGHGTVSGVRLLAVSPEFEPVERELAFGLALRSSALDRDLWDEDHPLLAQWRL